MYTIPHKGVAAHPCKLSRAPTRSRLDTRGAPASPRRRPCASARVSALATDARRRRLVRRRRRPWRHRRRQQQRQRHRQRRHRVRGVQAWVQGMGHGARRRLRRQGRWWWRRRRRRRRQQRRQRLATARVVGAASASAASAAGAVPPRRWGGRRRPRRRGRRRLRRLRRRWGGRRRRRRRRRRRWWGLAASVLSARPNPRSRRGEPCCGDPTRGIEPRTPTAGCCRGGPPSGERCTASVPGHATP